MNQTNLAENVDVDMENTPPLVREAVDFQYYAKERLHTEKAGKIDFNNRPYLKEIYDNYFAKEVVLKKSAQAGLTGWAVNGTIFCAEYLPFTTIYVFPTVTDVREFSKARFDPIIQSSKENISVDMETDNAGLKRLGYSFIYFRGAFGERQALSVPADQLIFDELDRCRPDIVQTYNERLTASKFKFKKFLSTPTIKDFGIDRKWNESDKREWYVVCPKCSAEQVLTEKHINYDANEYRCQDCHTALDNRIGFWRATTKSDKGIIGYHPTQLICPWISPREIVDKRKDYKYQRDFYNFVLAETFEGGDDVVTRAHILACMQSGLPTTGRATLGLDWGDESWFVIRRPGRIIHYGSFKGDTRTHPKQAMEMASKFKADIIPDFGYGDTKNREIIDRYREGSVHMCIYSKNGHDLYPRWVANKHEVHVERTRSLEMRIEDICQRKVQIEPNDAYQESLISHYQNIYKDEEEDEHGKRRIVIKRKGADHLVHADNYASLPELTLNDSNPRMIAI